jgi:polyisoprenoid-binding protein YceI
VARSRARRSNRWLLWLAGLAVAVVVLAVGGTFVYIHFISGPAPATLGLKSSGSSPAPSGGTGTAGSTGSVAGTWKVTTGSVVGYRVKEVLLGQHQTAVGRSSAVTGHLTISGTKVTAGTFAVLMDTIKSNESQRDVQFNGRIMNTATYPTGTLTLTRPITIAPLPAVGVVRKYTATGKLTLHGHTRAVTFPLSAERTASQIEISGSIPILFADWDIPNPSFTGFVTTQNHGVLEFLLKLSRS